MGALDSCSIIKQQFFLGVRQNLQLFRYAQLTFARYCPTFYSFKNTPLDRKLLTSIFKSPYIFGQFALLRVLTVVDALVMHPFSLFPGGRCGPYIGSDDIVCNVIYLRFIANITSQALAIKRTLGITSTVARPLVGICFRA